MHGFDCSPSNTVSSTYERCSRDERMPAGKCAPVVLSETSMVSALNLNAANRQDSGKSHWLSGCAISVFASLSFRVSRRFTCLRSGLGWCCASTHPARCLVHRPKPSFQHTRRRLFQDPTRPSAPERSRRPRFRSTPWQSLLTFEVPPVVAGFILKRPNPARDAAWHPLPAGYVHLGVAREITPTLRDFNLDPDSIIKAAGLDPRVFDNVTPVESPSGPGPAVRIERRAHAVSAFRPPGRSAARRPVAGAWLAA